MLWWFAETTLIAGLLALVAMLAPRLGRLGPAARHMLWLLVIIKLMTPPVIRASWPFASVREMTSTGSPIEVKPVPARVTEEFEPLALVEAEDVVVGPQPEPSHQGELSSTPVIDREKNPSVKPQISRASFVQTLWLLGSGIWGLGQLVRILRFRRRLNGAKPAPEWLLEETEQLGADLGIRVPEMIVVPSLDVPSLWCLGRPRLMLPQRLVATAGIERWRGILAHELAHLKRGDHWVARLELVAGLIWWWNPLYWFARRRLDAEAELACDAWVVAILPEDRYRYAETLLEVCASLSRSQVPLPTLGIGGAGRLFERRLSMILHDKVPYRVSFPCLLGAGILGLFAAPTWVAAEPPNPTDVKVETRVASSDDKATTSDSDKKAPQEAKEEEEKDDVIVIGEDGKVAPREKKFEFRLHRDAGPKGHPRIGIDIDLSGLDELFGPDSEFSKNLEQLVRDIEKQLGPGSDLEKSVKDLGEKVGQEMKEKFGPGSEFEKQVREKFGPGSNFERELKGKLGPRLEFDFRLRKHHDEAGEPEALAKQRAEERLAKERVQSDLGKIHKDRAEQMRKLHEQMRRMHEQTLRRKHEVEAKAKEAKVKAREAEAKRAEAKAKEKDSESKSKGRDERIREIENKLNKLLDELKELKSEGNGSERLEEF